MLRQIILLLAAALLLTTPAVLARTGPKLNSATHLADDSIERATEFVARLFREFKLSQQPSLKGRTVLIDAGHGGKDPGCTRLGIREKDITLRVALQLKAEFEERGATVYLTRADDADLELADIAAIIANRKPDLFLSIHVNSSDAASTKRSGIQTYFRESHSRLLAHTVHAHLLRNTGACDQKVHTANFWVLNSLMTPSLLIETGYINNRPDRKLLLDSRYRAKLAAGIVDGVTDYWLKKQIVKAP